MALCAAPEELVVVASYSKGVEKVPWVASVKAPRYMECTNARVEVAVVDNAVCTHIRSSSLVYSDDDEVANVPWVVSVPTVGVAVVVVKMPPMSMWRSIDCHYPHVGSVYGETGWLGARCV